MRLKKQSGNHRKKREREREESKRKIRKAIKDFTLIANLSSYQQCFTQNL